MAMSFAVPCQAAVSHHVRALEARLGVTLFRRLPHGLALTDEGAVLVPVLADAFERIQATFDRFADGRFREVLTVGVVGTFATGWLLPRLAGFTAAHPAVDLRILTNNNRVDLAGEGLDLAIRFGDGAWHGVEATVLLAAPLTPLCAPALARRLKTPPISSMRRFCAHTGGKSGRAGSRVPGSPGRLCAGRCSTPPPRSRLRLRLRLRPGSAWRCCRSACSVRIWRPGGWRAPSPSKLRPGATG